MQTFRSLRHRNYRLYFLGQMISLVGSWMQTTALMSLAYDLTHLSRWPAFLMAAMIGPTVILGVWAGSLADRFSRHALIVRTQTGFFISASILTAVVYSGAVNVGILLLLMFCHGIIQSIDLPTRLAFVPTLVERDDLINTVALNSLQFNIARAIGPGLAGVLLLEFGPAVCFLVNALSYLAVLAALSLMTDIPEPPAPVLHEKRPSRYQILRQSPHLVILISLAFVVAISGWPLLSLLPAFAEKVLHAQKGYSFLLSSVGIGALLSALTAATIGTERRQRRMLSSGLVLVSLALAGLSQVDRLWQACFLCAVFGYGMILFFATGQAAVQLGAGDQNRGVIMGFWAMMLSAGAPVGNLILGPSADAWGVATVLSWQAGLVAMATVLALLRPGLKRHS